MKIKMDVIAKKAIKILQQKGYEAYLVGGSLRDMLLLSCAKDIDIATSALPQQVMEAFSSFNTIQTGIEFGTVTVIIDDCPVEVTTFRSEKEYIKNRKPSSVKFEDDIAHDLKRRDFTINAMAYNEENGLIDLFSGIEDLEKKIIRAVGDPDERFSEDALRMLRAVRFASALDFEIEKDTLDAIIKNSGRIESISMPRINSELSKILISKNPAKGMRLLFDTGLIEHMIPELTVLKGFDQKNPYHSMDLLEHTLCVVENTKPDLIVRLGALFHDIAKPDTMFTDDDEIGHFYGHDKEGSEKTIRILRRLQFSNEVTRAVSDLVRHHMIDASHIGKKGIKKLLGIFGEDDIFRLSELHRADTKCTSMDQSEDLLTEKIKEVLDHKEPFSRKDMDIDGNDLISHGVSGRRVGELLDILLDCVLEDEKLNQKDKLLGIAVQLIDYDIK